MPRSLRGWRGKAESWPGAFPASRSKSGRCVEEFANPFEKCFAAERLLNKRGSGGENAAMDDDVIGIAGHVENPQVRPGREKLAGQFGPAMPGITTSVNST